MPRPLRMLFFLRDHRWTQRHLSDYIDGDLDPRERDRVERHVGMCPQCRRLLETLKRTVAGLMGLRDAPTGDVADGVIERLRAEGEG
jgi:anti-sigma factor RsiW